MKPAGARNLTRNQRLLLEDCMKAKLHKKDIAKKLGVCLATVYNELKRGEYEYLDGATWIKHKRYSPEIAQKKYLFNMTSKGAPIKLGSDYDFVQYVELRILKDKLSPGAVLGEIKRNNLFKTRISKTTLYRYIADGMFLNLSMKDCPFGSRKKRYKKVVGKRPPRGVSIEYRPKEILERNTFGHWEMDCVCGPTLSSLLVLSERMTRKELIFRIPNKNSDTIIKCIDSLEREYGKSFRKVFKTITVDNGSEFSNWKNIERSKYGGKRTTVYFCHPYCSSERGTNERLNRDIRRLMPKGTDFSKCTDDQIKHVEHWINSYPRQIFNFATADELFFKQLQSL